MVCTRRRRAMVPEYNAPIVTVMIVMANSAVAIVVTISIAVMVPDIIAVAVLICMTFGKSRSAESQR